ncbi:MAG: hypothetical protein ABI204_00940 [Ginsengibacter sp.]
MQKVLQKIAPDSLLSNEIAAFLKISRSEAYNKISGKSALTLMQINSLCNKYDLDFAISGNTKSNDARVSFTPFNAGKTDMRKYLLLLNEFMKELQQEQVSKLSCTTDDIPFFHLFKYPELAAFKLHFWDTRIPKKNHSSIKHFDFKSADKKNIKAAYELHNTYTGIPSMEIWTKNYLLIITDQIKYACETELLKDKQLANTICEQLLETLADIETYAINGSKSKRENVLFDWYQCDVVGNVSYLAETADKQVCFLRFNTFNNLKSDNEQLCKEVGMWMKFLLNNSIGFSGHGSNQRDIYLKDLKSTIVKIQDEYI